MDAAAVRAGPGGCPREPREGAQRQGGRRGARRAGRPRRPVPAQPRAAGQGRGPAGAVGDLGAHARQVVGRRRGRPRGGRGAGRDAARPGRGPRGARRGPPRPVAARARRTGGAAGPAPGLAPWPRRAPGPARCRRAAPGRRGGCRRCPRRAARGAAVRPGGRGDRHRPRADDRGLGDLHAPRVGARPRGLRPDAAAPRAPPVALAGPAVPGDRRLRDADPRHGGVRPRRGPVHRCDGPLDPARRGDRRDDGSGPGRRAA